MKKKGQITIFVILGVVIIALIVLFLTFRKDIIPPSSQQGINAEMREAQRIIDDCLEQYSEDYIKKIALQGGYLSPPINTYRLWNNTQVSYLCFNIEDREVCRNRLLTLRKMENELGSAIEEGLKECVDLSGISGVDITEATTFDVNVQILPYQVSVELNHPVTIESRVSDAVASRSEFTYLSNAPLGDLYQVSVDIIESETSLGAFDQLTYMLMKLSKYTIYVNKPYPDKLYQVKMREGDFIFQFAVEGEPS